MLPRTCKTVNSASSLRGRDVSTCGGDSTWVCGVHTAFNAACFAPLPPRVHPTLRVHLPRVNPPGVNLFSLMCAKENRFHSDNFMPTARQQLQRDFAAGRLTPDSGLEEVRGIGEYLLQRIQVHLAIPGRLTIRAFWNRTRTLSTDRIRGFLMRALQNERANQCVSKRTSTSPRRTYHTQDVNQRAYEVVVALLDRNRNQTTVRYGPLMRRMPSRSTASKECGCMDPCGGRWCRIADDGACVPRRGGRGFLGSLPHPNQTVHAPTEVVRKSIRNSARTRVTNATLRDAASMEDIRNGHRKSMRYSVHGTRMHRRPSPKVRLPNR